MTETLIRACIVRSPAEDEPTKKAPLRLSMPYAGADWVQSKLLAINKQRANMPPRKNSRSHHILGPLSPLGRTVADVLGYVYRGFYHLPGSVLTFTDWTHRHAIRVCVPSGLCTFDGSELTTLVVLCHDMMLRMEIGNGSPFYSRLTFSQRETRDAAEFMRMPTIEEHIASIRARYTVEPT